MNASELQQELFQAIKASIPPSLSATEEIARVLDVSVDSVYRRMRGEKTISLDELQKLCTYYDISMDRLLNIQKNAFLFYGNLIDENSFSFDSYIDGIIANLTYFNKFHHREFYGFHKDVPIFHHFHFREIAAFKQFYYQKNILHLPTFKNQKFGCDDYSQHVFEKELKILDLYNQMNSVEIWSFETINSIIRQIEYYRDNQVFKSSKDPYKLYDAVERLLNHLEIQATLGYKFKDGDSTYAPLGEYNLYFNEMMLGPNEYLFILDGKKIAIINHSVINYMMTRDVAFTENIYKSMDNLMRRSTLLSVASEKERSRFFRILRDKIGRKKNSLAA